MGQIGPIGLRSSQAMQKAATMHCALEVSEQFGMVAVD